MLQVLEAIATALEGAGQRHSRSDLQSTAAHETCTDEAAVTDVMSEMAAFACQATPADYSVLTAATAIASQVIAALAYADLLSSCTAHLLYKTQQQLLQQGYAGTKQPVICEAIEHHTSQSCNQACCVEHSAFTTDSLTHRLYMLQVNQGDWESVPKATPAVAMQLLQMWLQSFQEPIFSPPLQQAISALLCTAPYSMVSDTLPTGANSAPMSAVTIPDQGLSMYVAVVQRLSVHQRAVVARLVTCVQAVRRSCPQNSLETHVSSVLQWLTRHLTGCDMCDDLTAQTQEQAAVVHFLEACMYNAAILPLLMPCNASHTVSEVTDIRAESQTATLIELLSSLHGSSDRPEARGKFANPASCTPADQPIQAYKPATFSTSSLPDEEPAAQEADRDVIHTASMADAGCLRYSQRLARKFL